MTNNMINILFSLILSTPWLSYQYIKSVSTNTTNCVHIVSMIIENLPEIRPVIVRTLDCLRNDVDAGLMYYQNKENESFPLPFPMENKEIKEMKGKGKKIVIMSSFTKFSLMSSNLICGLSFVLFAYF